MNRENKSGNEETRDASKLLLYDQSVFIAMINSRNYHLGTQKNRINAHNLFIFCRRVEHKL